MARSGPGWIDVVAVAAATLVLTLVLGAQIEPALAVIGPAPPHLLPATAQRARAASPPTRWIVGVDQRRRSNLRALLAEARARALDGLPAYVVAAGEARALASALQRAHALTFTEPDVGVSSTQSPAPGSLAVSNRWRSYIVADGLTPPPPGPLLAVVDTQAQIAHPAFSGSHVASIPPAGAATDEHGTATLAVAAARDTGLGFQGVYPGANALNVATNLSCTDVARKIVVAIRRRAAVLNMSFGSSRPCFVLYLAVMEAVAHDIVPVAAAGNEFLKGNPLSYPASYPHVLTVGAIGPDLKPTFFSTSNLGVDVAAPGIGIVSAVPPQFDHDGNRDGYEALSGTSFSAPMVSGMADWIRATRPDLNALQVQTLIRATAKDIWKRGYDADTGYGLPQLAKALNAPAPRRQRLEPNDDIPLVDGRFFGHPDPPIWHGQPAISVANVLDVFKNPVDVFRISVPGHTRVRVGLRVKPGSADLAVFRSGARTIGDRALSLTPRIRSSRTITVENRGSRRIYYVAMKAESVAAAYELTVSR